MICRDCRKAGILARGVLSAGDTVPMGSLQSALRLHKRCPGGTRCDCQHAVPVVLRRG